MAKNCPPMDCGSGFNPNDNCICVPSGPVHGNQVAVNFQQLSSGFAARYLRNSTEQVLINNGLVANTTSAKRLSQKAIAKILYDYYLANGKEMYGTLLMQITPPSASSLSVKDANIIATAAPALDEVAAASNIAIPSDIISSLNNNGMNNQAINARFGDNIGQFWDALVGGSTSTTTPVLTTITKTSVIAIIGIILVVGILAFVIVKS